MLGLLLSACSKKTSVIHIANVESIDTTLVQTRSVARGYQSPCRDPLNYIPQDEYPLEYYMQTVRLFAQFVDHPTEQYNFQGDEARVFFWNLVNNANERLRDNHKMNLPEGNDTPVLDPLIQWRIADVPMSNGERTSAAFPRDIDHCWYLSKGKDRNNYSKEVIKKYAVAPDSLLNVFFISTHPDSVASPTYKARIAGIALGTSVKIAGAYELGKPWWDFSTTLNHENGHVFGLGHSWYKNDGCEDTPPHSNCYHQSDSPPCDGPTSNNFMDYNSSQMAVTPCQIGKMHRSIANIKGKQRGLVDAVWCQHDTSQSIIIDHDRKWAGHKDLRHSVIVKAGSTLMIQCRASFPAGSKIVIEPGAKLILQNAMLHNSCGDKWGGIELLEKGNLRAELELIGNCKIEDVLSLD